MPKLADPRRAGLPKRHETQSTESATDVARNAILAEIPEIRAPFEVISNDSVERPEESEASAELAQARAHQVTLESAHARLLEEEKATASERFDRMARDWFVADRAAWLADPAVNLPIFGSTFEGAKYLASLWADIAAMLAPDAPGPTFEQARQAAAALGSHWRIAQVRGDGAWAMARYVRASADAESVIARWIKESGTPDDTRERAAWLLRQAPEALEARAELARRAAAERDRWSAEAARLQVRADASRAALTETSVGTGSADPALEKRFRLLNRLLTQARSRTDKLQRRLDTLKKQRPAKEMRPAKVSRDRQEKSATQQPFDSKSNRNLERSPIPIEPDSAITPNLPDDRISEPAANAIPAEPRQSDSIVAEPTGIEMPGEIDDERRKRLLHGISRFRRMDWSDPRKVAPEDVEVITNLRNLPESLQRDTIVRLTFGTEKILGKAWRQYLRWRDEFQPMGVAPASFEG